MKAMILSAGYGTRLAEFTRDIPKPMLPLNGRPMLEYIIRNLARSGYNEIIINLHYKADLIRDHFRDGSSLGVSITYSYESEIMGTAGGLKNVEYFFRNEKSFLVHYGDILTDENFKEMYQFHVKHDALSTLLLHKRSGSNSVLEMDDHGRIISFLERPENKDVMYLPDTWVNSGVCICKPEIFDDISSAKIPSDLPRDVFTCLVKRKCLYGYPLTGYRCAIDSKERFIEAERSLCQGVCQTFLV